ncbi:MAG: hypothetical protein ABIY52_04145 [Gemmatimonadaceae bacterium]
MSTTLSRKPLRKLTRIALRATRTEQQHAGIGHQCRPDELVAARLFMIAVDEHELRPHAHERGACALSLPHEMREVPRQLDRRSEESGGEWIG